MTLVGPNRGFTRLARQFDRRVPQVRSAAKGGERRAINPASRASKHLASQHEFSKMDTKPPVIRASGGRCEIACARCARRPSDARGCVLRPGRLSMKSAVLEK